MALGTKPAAFVDGNELTADQLNALVTLLEILGFTVVSGGTGEGTIEDANVKTGAGLNKSKIGDVALVSLNTINPGTQNVQRPTMWTAGAERIDASDRSGSSTAIADSAGNQSVALPDDTKRIQRFSMANTTVNNALINAITGGTANKRYTLVFDNLDAAQTISLVHTSADAANNIKLKNGATRVVCAAATKSAIELIFGDLNASGVSQWWEV